MASWIPFQYPDGTTGSIRDRSIFMGIRDREICNGTTGYFLTFFELLKFVFYCYRSKNWESRRFLSSIEAFCPSASISLAFGTISWITSWILRLLDIRDHQLFWPTPSLISRSRVPINIDRSLMLTVTRSFFFIPHKRILIVHCSRMRNIMLRKGFFVSAENILLTKLKSLDFAEMTRM